MSASGADPELSSSRASNLLEQGTLVMLTSRSGSISLKISSIPAFKHASLEISGDGAGSTGRLRFLVVLVTKFPSGGISCAGTGEFVFLKSLFCVLEDCSLDEI